MIDRTSYTTAEGALNGDEALAFGEWWQSLFEEGYSPGTSQDPADRDNKWQYRMERSVDDLVAAADFGESLRSMIRRAAR